MARVSVPQARFRARLVAHANRLGPADGGAWLEAHRLLCLHDDPALRPALQARLTRLRRSVWASNVQAIETFQQVVTALGPIPVAPLKGIGLLDDLYQDDISLRPMGDLDLLVPRGSIEEAIARLRQLGYHEPESSHRLRRVHHHRNLAGRRPTLELHTRLDHAYLPRSSWEDVAPSPAVAHDREVHKLGAAAELVYLLVHFYRHQPFSCLGWADEILALAQLRAPRDLVETATRFGCRTTLAICIGLFRQAVDPDFLPAVDVIALRIGRVRTWLHQQLFLSPPDVLQPMPRRHKLLEELHAALLADRAADGLAALGRRAVIRFLARYPTRLVPANDK